VIWGLNSSPGIQCALVLTSRGIGRERQPDALRLLTFVRLMSSKPPAGSVRSPMGELTSGSCLGQEEPIKMQVVIEQRRVQDDTVRQHSSLDYGGGDGKSNKQMGVWT
jgi:hypothetical protein